VSLTRHHSLFPTVQMLLMLRI